MLTKLINSQFLSSSRSPAHLADKAAVNSASFRGYSTKSLRSRFFEPARTNANHCKLDRRL